MAVINPEWVTKEVGSFQTAEEMNTLATAVKNNAVELQTDITNLSTHVNNKSNPHEVTKAQLNLENVDNVSDANKPVSIAQAEAIAVVQTDIDNHEANLSNPHAVTKAQVGLSEVDNTSDLNKPISIAQQTAINAVSTTFNNHINDTDNPHNVTKIQLGLSNVDNTSDMDKPISNAQNIAFNDLRDDINGHEARTDNPHNVTKAQIGLSAVDNTSDANKPISLATQTALNLKADKARQVIAGSGLTGGGTLESDRTINVTATDDSIVVTADGVKVDTQNSLTSTSVTKPLAANQGKVLDEKITQVGADLSKSNNRISNLENYNNFQFDLSKSEIGFYTLTPPSGEINGRFKRMEIVIPDNSKELIITAACRSNAYNSITDMNNNVLWQSNAILNEYKIDLKSLSGIAKYLYFCNETSVQPNPKIICLLNITDSSLSTESKNPVENKVVSEAINLINTEIEPLIDPQLTNNMTNAGYISVSNGLVTGATGTWVHSDIIKKELFVSADIVTNASVASVACYSTNEILTAAYLGNATGITSPTTLAKNLTYPVGTQYVVISSNAVSSPQNVTYLQNSEFKTLQIDIDSLKTNVSTLNAQILKQPDISPKMLHFSFDDTIASLRDLNDKVGIYTSIFDSPFFGALKTLHDTHGCVFSCYCFYNMIDLIYVSKLSDIVSPKTTSVYYLGSVDGSYTVGYYVYVNSVWTSFDYTTMNNTYTQFSLANMTNSFSAEFAANSSWLKFGLHSIDAITNYVSETAIKAKSDYDNFITQILRITGTPDCVDLVVRLQNFAGNLVSCQAMRDADCGLIGFLTGDYAETSGGLGGNSTGYYLASPAPTVLWNKGHWIDYAERLHFYPSSLRLDNTTGSNIPAYMAKYLTANKWGMAGMIIMYAHENQMFTYSTRTINSDYITRFNNAATWAKNNGFSFGYPMNRIRSTY